jgi:DNA-binding NtrC family response regulator
VLSVGAIPQLLTLREAILVSEGYDVLTTANPEEAAKRIDEGRCGVLLLCYSIGPEWQHKLVERFRASCPKGRVVAITNHPITQPWSEVDRMVYGIDGPECLIDAVRGKAA